MIIIRPSLAIQPSLALRSPRLIVVTPKARPTR
jgi:hypothetical protein